MQQEKNEQIVVRIPESLKKKITVIADKKEIKVSQLVRLSLENLINEEEESEIFNQISIVQSIETKLERHMNHLIFIKNGYDNELKKTIRLYMQLVTEERENVIEIFVLEKEVLDNKTKKLVDKWTITKKRYESLLKDHYDDIDILLSITTYDQKMISLENDYYQAVGKLYAHVSQLYKQNKKL